MTARTLAFIVCSIGAVNADPPAKLRAASPALTVPAEVRMEVGGFAVVTADTLGKSVKFVPLDTGLQRFPPEFISNPKAAILMAPGVPAGKKIRVLVYSAVGDEPTEPAICTILIGPPVVVPPVDPPPQTGGAYYFLLIRPDGPASPEFTRIVSDPAWNKLRMKGHSIKDKTVTEAASPSVNVKLPSGTMLPVVVTLQIAADGMSSTIVRPAIPLPTTAAGVEALLNDLP